MEITDKTSNFATMLLFSVSFFILFTKIIFKTIAIPIPIINPIPKLFFIIGKSAILNIFASGSPMKRTIAPPKNQTNVFINPSTYPIPTKSGDI